MRLSLSTASSKARKHKGAARIDGPQLLSVYGRALDAAVNPSVIMGVHEAELYDPNEVSVLHSRCYFTYELNGTIQSSLEQSEIQSRLRLWQERQEQIERQQYVPLMQVHRLAPER